MRVFILCDAIESIYLDGPLAPAQARGFHHISTLAQSVNLGGVHFTWFTISPMTQFSSPWGPPPTSLDVVGRQWSGARSDDAGDFGWFGRVNSTTPRNGKN